ncbi:quinone oxidoreductase [Ktedonosporobacter rubrisoli]|uniref:Quinone oxidoreductase n=1 Tax=Ktedonosporobacter rubrisoli TaxID=2509675 RepID=A0A4P6K651_KTERU|nr:quinone oxidoreductase [Ktedonosporobacter rubrisoli]
MKAIRIPRFGDHEVLSYEDVKLPEPGAGEVRIKQAAIGVNFIDIYHRKGLYPNDLPFTPGSEGSGTVDAVGEGVTDLKVGDRVAYAMALGAYAEYFVIAASRLVPVPEGVSLEQAAAVMLQGTTAHYLATSTYQLQPGDTALVHAAAGGVGQLLTQIAKLCGARVIGTVSTEEKADLARSLGADEVILYTQENFEEVTKRLTAGKGVQVVYDSVGKDTFNQSLNCLRPRGYLVLYGQSSGPVPPLDPQILNAKGSLFLTRPSLGHYIATREELLQRAGDVFDWIAAGKLRVRIDRSFPLAQASSAHEYLEGRQSRGKILLIP